MRVRKERRAEKEWRQQEIWERRKEENRQRAIEERKYFAYGGFGHMAYNCRNVGKEGLAQAFSNKFEVLKSRVIQKREGSRREVIKDKREILREEKAKREVEVQKTGVEKKKEKERYLREVIVKIGLKQKEEKEGIVVDTVTNFIQLVSPQPMDRFSQTKLR